MEKKTIGKFISALRKANGMTQKELGEKLFVSDKTVSRWERDECTPELSLIPLIAEIFSVTADELLRGERNNPDRKATASEEETIKQRAKSDKRFKLMLEIKKRKYRNLTLISVGITILGVIAAMIACLGFSGGLIAFCLAAAFFTASEMCQICFAINARVIPDEDDDTYTDRIKKSNTGVIETATKISFVNLLAFAFCLPLVTLINGVNYGLAFKYWLCYGLLFSAVAFVICYVVYKLFVYKILCDRGLIFPDENQREKNERNKKLLVKTLVVSSALAFALGACIVVCNVIGYDVAVQERTFYNCSDFKAFMESEYDAWYNENYGGIITSPDDEKNDDGIRYPNKIYKKITNSNGEIICEYYYNPSLYADIRFTDSADDKMPVTLISLKSHYEALDIIQTLQSILYAIIALDFIVAAGVYSIKIHKNTQKAAESVN